MMVYANRVVRGGIFILFALANTTFGAGCMSASSAPGDGKRCDEEVGVVGSVDESSAELRIQAAPRAVSVRLESLSQQTTVTEPLDVAAGGGGDDVSDPARIVQQGDYDVTALGEEVSLEIHRKLWSLLRREHGSAVYHWRVREADGWQDVYAAPHLEGERLRLMNDEIDELMAAGAVYCNWLYKYYFWSGSAFKICGSFGEHGYTNLASYGFDNQISSYFVDSTGCAVDLYDSTNYSSFLIKLDWDLGVFDGAYNDKTTSVWGWYP